MDSFNNKEAAAANQPSPLTSSSTITATVGTEVNTNQIKGNNNNTPSATDPKTNTTENESTQTMSKVKTKSKPKSKGKVSKPSHNNSKKSLHETDSDSSSQQQTKRRGPGRPPGSRNRATIARMKAEQEAIELFRKSNPDMPSYNFQPLNHENATITTISTVTTTTDMDIMDPKARIDDYSNSTSQQDDSHQLSFSNSENSTVINNKTPTEARWPEYHGWEPPMHHAHSNSVNIQIQPQPPLPLHSHSQSAQPPYHSQYQQIRYPIKQGISARSSVSGPSHYFSSIHHYSNHHHAPPTAPNTNSVSSNHYPNDPSQSYPSSFSSQSLQSRSKNNSVCYPNPNNIENINSTYYIQNMTPRNSTSLASSSHVGNSYPNTPTFQLPKNLSSNNSATGITTSARFSPPVNQSSVLHIYPGYGNPNNRFSFSAHPSTLYQQQEYDDDKKDKKDNKGKTPATTTSNNNNTINNSVNDNENNNKEKTEGSSNEHNTAKPDNRENGLSPTHKNDSNKLKSSSLSSSNDKQSQNENGNELNKSSSSNSNASQPNKQIDSGTGTSLTTNRNDDISRNPTETANLHRQYPKRMDLGEQDLRVDGQNLNSISNDMSNNNNNNQLQTIPQNMNLPINTRGSFSYYFNTNTANVVSPTSTNSWTFNPSYPAAFQAPYFPLNNSYGTSQQQSNQQQHPPPPSAQQQYQYSAFPQSQSQPNSAQRLPLTTVSSSSSVNSGMYANSGMFGPHPMGAVIPADVNGGNVNSNVGSGGFYHSTHGGYIGNAAISRRSISGNYQPTMMNISTSIPSNDNFNPIIRNESYITSSSSTNLPNSAGNAADPGMMWSNINPNINENYVGNNENVEMYNEGQDSKRWGESL